jgi:hypothetical protein
VRDGAGGERRRVLRLLNAVTADEMVDAVRHLAEFRGE